MTIHRFENKNFIVTGAADGIGFATAKRLHQEGATVALFDLQEEKVLEKANELDGRAKAYAVDISDEQAVEKSFSDAVTWMGGLNGLVNAAGFVDFGNSHEYPLERWRRLLDVVLTGTFITNKAAIPFLINNKGSVVNIGSIGGLRGKAWQAAYSAAKGGVINLTRALACEYVGRIRFNTVCPGQVNNNIAINSNIKLPEGVSDTEFIAEYSRRVMAPNGGGSSEEIAGVVTFLLSDDAAYMEGSTVVVDGATLA